MISDNYKFSCNYLINNKKLYNSPTPYQVRVLEFLEPIWKKINHFYPPLPTLHTLEIPGSTTMRRILENKNDRSKNQAFQNRMAAIIGRLIEAGFDGMSFKQERDFLLSLYPFAHKEYCIRIWRTNETDYRWEAKGRFSDKTIEGYFQSMDCQAVSVETSVDCIAGKEITDDERKLLAKHGLADKSLWFDSDFKKVWKLLNVYAADNNFCNFC